MNRLWLAVSVVLAFAVQMSAFDPLGRFAPTYDVVASSTRFSFEDLLRQLAAA